jgi:predicted esterase
MTFVLDFCQLASRSNFATRDDFSAMRADNDSSGKAGFSSPWARFRRYDGSIKYNDTFVQCLRINEAAPMCVLFSHRFAFFLVVLSFALLSAPLPAQTLTERKVAAPTRLDWEFAAQGFKPAERKVPAAYDSTKQRYQLCVPKGASKTKSAALVLFISPGDGPQGWKNWQKLCEKEGVLFASPYGAGNSTQPGQRTRIVLDVLDDIRRQYAIDPDQTYLTGFSGGGRMACAIGFALPEYFGGIIPICGTNPISGPDYLRHRIEERLSIAFVTGEKDTNRKENEVYMAPWFEELGIRTKLWVAPKMGHAIPSGEVLSEAYAWVGADLQRRRDDAKARPKLAVGPNDTPSGSEQAKRFVEAAAGDLRVPARTWRGVALLQGVTKRWDKTPAGRDARQMLKEALASDALVERISEQGGADEVKAVSAQAKALERFGQNAAAIEAWSLLAKNYEGTPIGAKAIENIERLKAK